FFASALRFRDVTFSSVRAFCCEQVSSGEEECMRKRTVVLAAVVLSLHAFSRAEEFRSPDGFSLSYPSAWLAFSADARPDKVPANVTEWISKCKVDFGQTCVMIIHPSNDDFLEYVKVAPTKYLAVNNYNLPN